MRLRPSRAEMWKRHVENYTEVFRQALLSLLGEKQIDKNEIAISRRLNYLVQKKCFEFNKDLIFPIFDTSIISESDNENDDQKKSGRPDFSCRLKNHHATSHEESEIDFHVECKCLGFSKNSSWIYNENYVNHGIMRFDHEDKRYGENTSDGLMVGYVLSMSPEDICREVNVKLAKVQHNWPPIVFPLSSEFLKETSQKLKRTVIHPVDFTLTHPTPKPSGKSLYASIAWHTIPIGGNPICLRRILIFTLMKKTSTWI